MSKRDPAKIIQNMTTEIRVHLVPRSSRNQFVGYESDQFKIKLTAPPVDGQANKALIGFLSEKLGIAKNRVEIITGLTSRHKKIKICGLTLIEITNLLEK